MNVMELKDNLSLMIYAGKDGVSNEIGGCYIGDLLSLAMAKVGQGNVWVTIQTNVNIVAVASLAEAACIVIADGFVPDENTIEKANEMGIPILTSDRPIYEIAKDLAELGI